MRKQILPFVIGLSIGLSYKCILHALNSKKQKDESIFSKFVSKMRS